MKMTWWRRVLAVGAMVLGAVYLINPTAGVLELLPDALPFVGNLDEAGATALLIWGIRALRQSGSALPALPSRSGRPGDDPVAARRSYSGEQKP